jgi:LmbE family N-acetylglucosaminyl deacetylase
MSEEILVIAAHPDDEILGCGGTLLKHKSIQDNIHLLFISDGETSRHNGEENIDDRVRLSEEIKKKLDAKSLTNFLLPDNKLDSIPLLEIVKKIEIEIEKINPTKIYTHHPSDLNVDHQIVFKSVLTAARPFPGSSIKEILSFEIVSSTEWNYDPKENFKPNLFIDISNQFEEKLELLKIYKKELYNQPHARSLENIKNLNKFRGSSVGFDYAEAFSVIRMIR